MGTILFVIALVLVVVYAIAKYGQSRSAENPTSITSGGTPRKPLSDEYFAAELRKISRGSGGTVQVVQRSGKRLHPGQMKIQTMPQPGICGAGKAFISATVWINGISYEFHAHIREGLSNLESRGLRISVIGPTKPMGGFKDDDYHLKPSECVLDPRGRWLDDVPFNPGHVRQAVKAWKAQPEVAAAIRQAMEAPGPR